eukprot:gi/632968118/ref/XP_007900353.1/ PREDICTED: uncharacterized protein LOC103184250 [Callorhinchus milii]
MKRSRESDLSTIISNLHQSRQHGMPESQGRTEIKNNGIDLLPGQAGVESCWDTVPQMLAAFQLPRPSDHSSCVSPDNDILGKRRVCSPNSNSECPEVKKQRSQSPKEKSYTPALEDQIIQMTPEEHYRRMMSALNEHGTYDEQQQRLYQLANSMGVPSHGGKPPTTTTTTTNLTRTDNALHVRKASQSAGWFPGTAASCDGPPRPYSPLSRGEVLVHPLSPSERLPQGGGQQEMMSHILGIVSSGAVEFVDELNRNVKRYHRGNRVSSAQLTLRVRRL